MIPNITPPQIPKDHPKDLSNPVFWIGAFFLLLLTVNVGFYIVALNQPDQLIPPEERAPTAGQDSAKPPSEAAEKP